MKKTYAEIGIDKLVPYSEHLFSLYDKERLQELSESIKQHGILSPLIVRKYDFKGNYMILSGHNRANAAKLVGLRSAPCIVVDKLTEDEEKLITIESNFYQRSIDNMKTSELAKAISMWYNTIKKQGFRTDLVDEIEQLEIECQKAAEIGKYFVNSENKNIEKAPENPQEIGANMTSEQLCTKATKAYDSAEIISQKTKLSPYNIRRYVRIAKLPDDILAYVDSGAISFVSAVELSYLTPQVLTYIHNALQLTSLKITSVSVEAARKLRTLVKKDVVTFKDVIDILKPVHRKSGVKITLKPELISEYFSGKSKKVVMSKLKNSLELTEHQIPELFAKHELEIDDDYYKAVYDILVDYFTKTPDHPDHTEANTKEVDGI